MSGDSRDEESTRAQTGRALSAGQEGEPLAP